MATKVRTTLYFDEEVKEEAKKRFKKFGLSFSGGINLLLERLVLDEEFREAFLEEIERKLVRKESE